MCIEIGCKKPPMDQSAYCEDCINYVHESQDEIEPQKDERTVQEKYGMNLDLGRMSTSYLSWLFEDPSQYKE